jgi:predicted Ser/Thr protein kinase
MKPTDAILCPECGKPVPPASQHQVCPACLLRQALASGTLVDGAPATAAPPPSPEEIARKFPQFEVTECLGRGGMGVVYKARQKSLDRWVAIKILPPERVGDGKFAERFAREAAILAKLSHPNIVTIHDFGETGGWFYIVMEYVDGVNLRDLLREGKLDPRQALAIVPPICEALQYAHDKGIVHRDIKPENLLLDRDGRIKIADFGIAGLIGVGGDGIGTPPYMAPEQAGAAAQIDHRADIYALGVVLYEMLTGERPAKELVAPSQKVQIDVRLDEMVLRALEQNPELRYQTAGEFKTVVETLAGGELAKPTLADAGAQPPSINRAERELRRGGIVLVGRRNGQRVIVWPGVIHTLFVILGILSVIGCLVSLVRPLDPLLLIVIVMFPILVTAGGVVLGLKTPPERLVAMDDSHTGGEINPSHGGQSLPHGMVRRWWWVLLVMIPLGMLLGLGVGGIWSYVAPRQFEVRTTLKYQSAAATAERTVGPLSGWNLSAGLESDETLTRLEHQLDLGKRWMRSDEEVRRMLRKIITAEPISGTTLVAIKVRSTDLQECIEIARALPEAYLAPEGSSVVVVDAEALPARVAPNVPLILAISTTAGIPFGLLLALPLMALLQRVFPERKTAADLPAAPPPLPVADLALSPAGLTPAGDDPSRVPRQRPSVVPYLVLHAVLLAGVAAVYLGVVPRYATLFREFGAQLPVITRLVISLPLNGVILAVPVLLAVDLGCCFLMRQLGGRRGLFWWTLGVVSGLALVAVVAIASITIPLRKVVEVLGSDTATRSAAPSAPPPLAAVPDGPSELVAVEDLALHMIVAIREKDDAKLKSLATVRIMGWPDALPVFAVELREHVRQATGSDRFDLRVSGSRVSGDLAVVKCTGPATLNGMCLVLNFIKTPAGWRNHSLRNSSDQTPLAEHIANLQAAILKAKQPGPPAPPPAAEKDPGSVEP